MNKYGNTIKMMGADFKTALDFSEACTILGTYVNQELTKKARETIFNTVVMGKTMREWYEYLTKEQVSKGLLSTAEMNHISLLVELVCQEYYKKEGYV